MAWHTPITRLFNRQPEVKKIQRRRYAGAAISRLTDGWVSSNTSADAEIKVSLRKLRDRSRQLMRDNPYAKQAKRTTQINVIGQGVKLQCMVPAIRGKKKDKRLSMMIEAEWKKWCKRDNCDVSGQKSFFMLENLAVGALVESGEVFLRIVRRKFGKSTVPLALEIIRGAFPVLVKTNSLLPSALCSIRP